MECRYRIQDWYFNQQYFWEQLEYIWVAGVTTRSCWAFKSQSRLIVQSIDHIGKNCPQTTLYQNMKILRMKTVPNVYIGYHVILISHTLGILSIYYYWWAEWDLNELTWKKTIEVPRIKYRRRKTIKIKTMKGKIVYRRQGVHKLATLRPQSNAAGYMEAMIYIV